MVTASVELAREALRMAEAEPGRALQIAARAAGAAREARNATAGAIAERAWGLAAFHTADVDTAVSHLRASIALARRAGSAQLGGEARMTLAFVLNWRGQPRLAVRTINAAVRDLTGVQRARAQAQRGAILHQLGRLAEALACYRAALPVLRRAGDQLWVQRTLSNRGNLHSRRGEFAAAQADLAEAERLCRQLELDLSIGFVHHNLGHVNIRRGDVPAALDYLDRAELAFRALGSQLGPLLVDRSELLLSVRLIAEAREAAEQAVLAYQDERRRIVLPEARLLLARAAMLEGDVPAALRQAHSAAREFSQQGQTRWAALAKLTVFSCRIGSGRPGRLSLARLERTIEATSGEWPDTALEALLAAARLALTGNHRNQARRLLAQASRARRSGTATTRARAWQAEALLREDAGNHRGAATAARTGLRILDEHAAALGATDLRAHVAGHRTELAGLGLRIAIRDRRAVGVLEWAERGRASHLLYPPARPPEDPVLAADLAELRATIRQIDELRAEGRSSSRLRQHQNSLERRIRDHHRRQRGHGTTGPPVPSPLRSLRSTLGDAALIEFVQLDGTMYAVSVVGGRTRLREAGSVAEISDLVDRIPFALHRLARGDAGAPSRLAASTLLRHSAARLDALLLGPLPEAADRPLVVIPTGPLQSLPWSVLPSCAGRPLTVSPSALLWQHALLGAAGAPGHVCIAAGPGLPGAHIEAKEVGEIHHRTPLTGQAASVDAVTAALNGASLAHIAAHGRVRGDNPLFSSLRLADGPLMVYDLEKLQQAPHTVVLAACDTGRPVVRTGDELLGLTATLLAQGTTQLIAPVLTVLDTETTAIMVAFHEHIAAGQDPASALASVRRQIRPDDFVGLATAAGFVCLGAGFVPPPLP